jgi:hypothetical protein
VTLFGRMSIQQLPLTFATCKDDGRTLGSAMKQLLSNSFTLLGRWAGMAGPFFKCPTCIREPHLVVSTIFSKKSINAHNFSARLQLNGAHTPAHQCSQSQCTLAVDWGSHPCPVFSAQVPAYIQTQHPHHHCKASVSPVQARHCTQ